MLNGVTEGSATLSIMAFSIMTFSIMTISIMTFSIMTFCNIHHDDTQHNCEINAAECYILMILRAQQLLS
jgi:hypothetical protein